MANEKASPQPTTSSSSAENEAKFLLNLPPELRVRIYDYLFAPTTRSPQREVTTLTWPDNTDTFPGLMRTCSFLRREAMPQYLQHLAIVKAETVSYMTLLRREKSSAMYRLEGHRMFMLGRTESADAATKARLALLRTMIEVANTKLVAAQEMLHRIHELLTMR